jgi:hypothetical protein
MMALPRLEERLLLSLVEREYVNRHNRGGIDRELTLDRKAGSSGRSSDMMGSFRLDV